MNWGKGIITGMIIFMLFILSMCVYMFRVPADEYDHQYYEKGLSFDGDYQQEKQVSQDHAQPIIQQHGQMLNIIFTTPAIGKIHFVRPSSQAMDKTFTINTISGNMVSIPLADIKKGQWQLVLQWQSNHKKYLDQQKVYIQ